jgi:hypothetical protein
MVEAYDESIQLMDGYKIKWLTDETPEEIDFSLKNGIYDGIGINPFRGNGIKRKLPVIDCLSDIQETPRALVLPYVESLGVPYDFWDKWIFKAEFLLWGEYYEKEIVIGSPFLKVLRTVNYNSLLRITSSPNLDILSIGNPDQGMLNEFPVLFPGLKNLEIVGGSCYSLASLARIDNIKELCLYGLKKVSDLNDVSEIGSLIVLTIEAMPKIGDSISALSKLKNLNILRIFGCGKIASLSFLENMALNSFRCSRTKIIDKNKKYLDHIENVYISDMKFEKG